jgi:TATA-box binding protein (TBP) (component of TFIID and TFIIIB)
MSVSMNIDQEWENFISSGYGNNDMSSDDEEEECLNLDDFVKKNNDDYISANISMDMESHAPKATNIYISTKTKIAYLNKTIDLKSIFWNITVIPYSKPCNGVVKKQMKFNSTEKEELDFIQNKIKNEPYYEEHVITHIDNPSGRIKFKDIRKISIGLSKKDLMSLRCKKKSAFYNCFVMILRMKIDAIFKEFHVKVFNTGKLEIPGIQNEGTFQLILNEVITILQPYFDTKLDYVPETNETVLINSNFNCGFFINREALFDILKYRYNIQAIYDPCSYPGIQCKFYYNPDVDIQNGCQISEENKSLYKNIKEVSFMIFRTGSVLIVGKCDENVLMIIYEYLKIILNNEHKAICQKYSLGEENILALKDKTKKVRRKNIVIEINP